jgi:hypothetical protein
LPVHPPSPDLQAGVAIDLSDPSNPLVVFRLICGPVESTFRILAANAVDFGPKVGEALRSAGMQALAQSGSALLKPVPGLIVPGHLNGQRPQ